MRLFSLFIVINLFCLTCREHQKPDVEDPIDPCLNGHDTIYTLHFSPDSSSMDFYGLLDFIESKGQFSRVNREQKIDSSSTDSIVLKKILCYAKYYDSPIEKCILRGAYNKSCYFTSKYPLEENKDEFAGFRIIQINFVNEGEKEIAKNKINEMRWGEPFVASNFWFLVEGLNRIYILENFIPRYTEVTRDYSEFVKEEWVKKTSANNAMGKIQGITIKLVQQQQGNPG